MNKSTPQCGLFVTVYWRACCAHLPVCHISAERSQTQLQRLLQLCHLCLVCMCGSRRICLSSLQLRSQALLSLSQLLADAGCVQICFLPALDFTSVCYPCRTALKMQRLPEMKTSAAGYHLAAMACCRSVSALSLSARACSSSASNKASAALASCRMAAALACISSKKRQIQRPAHVHVLVARVRSRS